MGLCVCVCYFFLLYCDHMRCDLYVSSHHFNVVFILASDRVLCVGTFIWKGKKSKCKKWFAQIYVQKKEEVYERNLQMAKVIGTK